MNTKETIMQFVETGGRVFLAKPFISNNHYYASNGHVAVRMAMDETLKEGDVVFVESDTRLVDVVSKIDQWIADASQGQKFTAITKQTEMTSCAACCGSGKYRKCEDCGGNGCFVYGQHEYSCKNCDGFGLVEDDDGDFKCSMCNGSGEVPANILVNGVLFNGVTFNKLAGLPNAEICTNGINQKAVFRFAGGMGAIMPMRQ